VLYVKTNEIDKEIYTYLKSHRGIDLNTTKKEVSRGLKVGEEVIYDRLREADGNWIRTNNRLGQQLSNESRLFLTDEAEYLFALGDSWGGFIRKHFYKEPIGFVGLVTAVVAAALSLLSLLF